jgi:hypothetical protein
LSPAIERAVDGVSSIAMSWMRAALAGIYAQAARVLGDVAIAGLWPVLTLPANAVAASFTWTGDAVASRHWSAAKNWENPSRAGR